MKDTGGGTCQNQAGVAMVTILLIMVIMTVLGITAMTVTGLENKMAGLTFGKETASVAAESCIGTSVNLLQQTIDEGDLPAAYSPSLVPAAANPSTGVKLIDELMGRSDNDADSPGGTGASGPDIDMGTINGYRVVGDIDRLYAKPRAGSAIMFASGYEGTGAGGGAGGVDIFYRVDCQASNQASGTTSRIVAVYACTMNGESCQKK